MTGSRLALGLVAACLALSLAIMHELTYSPSPAPVRTGASGAPLGRDVSPGQSAARGQPEAMLHDVLARPLFSPDRRPVEVGVAAARGLPRLTGIVVAGSQRVAIFAARSNEQPIVAQAGAHVGAYEVRTIADAGVTMMGPEGETLIRPIFDVFHPAASAPPPARPPVPKPAAPTRTSP
jgi:hypothetical protein